MKSSFLIITIILLSISSLYSQTGIEFGVRASYNIGTQCGSMGSGGDYEIDPGARQGLSGGIIFSFPITDNFSIQHEFIYSQKGSRQDVSLTEPTKLHTISDYHLDYFELPVALKYKFARIRNVEFYGSSGFVYSMLLDSKYNVKGSVHIPITPGTFQEVPIEESGEIEDVDSYDFSFIYGVGADFKILTQKCFLEYRQIIGWNTLMMPTVEGGEDVPLRNMTYSISLGVLF